LAVRFVTVQRLVEAPMAKDSCLGKQENHSVEKSLGRLDESPSDSSSITGPGRA
jgi:hypothetical protein